MAAHKINVSGVVYTGRERDMMEIDRLKKERRNLDKELFTLKEKEKKAGKDKLVWGKKRLRQEGFIDFQFNARYVFKF